jgi:hypothetical protein
MPAVNTVARVVLIVNLAFVLLTFAAFALAGVIGYMVTGGRVGLVALTAIVGGAAVTWMTFRYFQGGDARLVLGIALLSVPAYAFAALDWRDQSGERALARTFLAGDTSAAAAAAETLAATGQRSGGRPAVRILVAALDSVREPDERRRIVELLGAVSVYDSSVVDALIPLIRAAEPAGPPSALRAAAFAALYKVNRYAIEVAGVRYVGLTRDGRATFAFQPTHRLFGDSVAVRVRGVVLPRADSPDRCEVEAAALAGHLIATALASAARTMLTEFRLEGDGGYAAHVLPDGTTLDALLDRKLPRSRISVDGRVELPAAPGEQTDWCHWLDEKP